MKDVKRMAVNPDITILMDFYGEMLTEKEMDALDYYYNDDLSLGEIAENIAQTRRLNREYGEVSAERDTITRQGVRDTIKRAENKLLNMEEKLGLVARFRALEQGLDEISAAANAIADINRRSFMSREISAHTDAIIETANKLKEDS